MKIKSIDKEINYLKELNSIKENKLKIYNKSILRTFIKSLKTIFKSLFFIVPIILLAEYNSIIFLDILGINAALFIVKMIIENKVEIRRHNYYKEDKYIEYYHDYSEELDYSKNNRFNGKTRDIDNRGILCHDDLILNSEDGYINRDLELSYEDTISLINEIIEKYKNIYMIDLDFSNDDFNKLTNQIYDILYNNSREKEFFSYLYHLIRITFAEAIALRKKVTINDLYNNLEFNAKSVEDNRKIKIKEA